MEEMKDVETRTLSLIAFFFFSSRRRHTRLQGDWSSDVCSSDLPDIQGIWSNATITPLERPKDLAGKEFFTEKEAAEYEKRILEETNKDRRDGDRKSVG